MSVAHPIAMNVAVPQCRSAPAVDVAQAALSELLRRRIERAVWFDPMDVMGHRHGDGSGML